MKTLSLFLVVLVITSCQYAVMPHRIKKELTYCYTNNNSGLDSLLDISGYYSFNQEYSIDRSDSIASKKYRLGVVTCYKNICTNILFFKDGIITLGFFDYEQQIPEYINEIYKRTQQGKKSQFYNYGYWGKYIIEDGIIKAQLTNRPSPLSATWMPFEVWFKIDNKNTIQLIASRYLHYTKSYQNKSHMDLVMLTENDYLSAKFTPLEVELPSNAWLKNRKWFWCNKEEYKKWKTEKTKNK